MKETIVDLVFGKNYNHKLNCYAFTAILLKRDGYKVGILYRINIESTFQKYARAIEIREIYLKDINNYISYLDLGVKAEEGKKLLKDAYKDRNINWETEKLVFVLFETYS